MTNNQILIETSGIGSDIIEIERIRSCIEEHRERFLERVFTAKEQEYCQRHQESAARFAGRFAAKEAVAKALGTGIGKMLAWKDIEIINQPSGKPEVHLSPLAKERFHQPNLLITISHCHLYALAVAIYRA